MKVTQIDIKEALALEAEGVGVMVMSPQSAGPQKRTDYMPDTIPNMLDGCLFFREGDACTYAHGWIPVETGHRPDIGKHVLVTLWDETVMEGFWTGAVWVAGTVYYADVTAWRLLPEPCRRAKEGGRK